jgi:hypothetical protein
MTSKRRALLVVLIIFVSRVDAAHVLRVLDARQTHRRLCLHAARSTLPAAGAAPSAAVSPRRQHACLAGARTPVHAAALRMCASSAVSSFPQRCPRAGRTRRGAPPTLWCAVRLAPDGSRSMGFLPDTSFVRRIPKQPRPPSLQGVPRTRFVAMDAARSSSRSRHRNIEY